MRVARALLVLWLVIVSCLAWLGTARAEAPISSVDPPAEILGDWAVAGGDDLKFADPEFDDSAWERRELSGTLDKAIALQRVVWFRKHVAFSPGAVAQAANGEMALSLGVASCNYELFIDGTRIGAWGSMDAEAPIRLRRPVALRVSSEAAADGELLVAVRTTLPEKQRIHAQRFQSSLRLFGQASAVESQAQLEVTRTHPRLFLIFSTSLAWMVCTIFFFQLWWRRRERRADLWFALTSSCFLVSSTSAGLSDYVETAYLPWGWEGVPMIFSLGLAAILEMSWEFLRRGKAPWFWRALQISLWLASAAVLFRVSLGRDLVGGFRVVVLLAALLAIVCLTTYEVFRGNRDARTVGIGWILAAVVAAYEPIADTLRWPPFPSTNAAAVILILATAYALLVQFIRSMDELDFTNRAIRRFVPFEFLDLLDKPSVRDIRVGDQVELELTVLFCDIRSFTSLSECLTPEETIQLVNDFLAQVEPRIHRQGGFINTYTGDGLMALFHTDVDKALRGGIEMFSALERWNAERARNGKPEVAIGVGLHTGKVMLGTLGSGDRLDTNVIGDSVNLAARVEGMTKLYGAPLLVTEALVQRLAKPDAVLLREVDRVVAKGKQEAVVIYEVLDAQSEAVRRRKRQTLEQFSAGLADYRNGEFKEALRVFRQTLQACPGDQAAALYIERCERLGVASPANWDGVTRLDTKG